MNAESNCLLIQDAGPVRTMVLNRPERLNAFDTELLERLSEGLRDAEGEDAVRTVVIRGAGRAFSAGADLSSSPVPEDDNAEYWRRRGLFEAGICRQVWELSKPVVAAVHGHCIGYALDLALAADYTIARDDARFSEPEIRHCSSATYLMMPYVVGLKATKRLLLTGDAVDAVEALRIGLVTATASEAEFDDAVSNVARSLAAIPPTAMRLNKASINHAVELMGLDHAVRYNLEVFAQALSSADAKAFNAEVEELGLKGALGKRDRIFDD
jgi:enoyl-CoA hydratase/carnithine racemase